jgi:hypothetical protein
VRVDSRFSRRHGEQFASDRGADVVFIGVVRDHFDDVVNGLVDFELFVVVSIVVNHRFRSPSIVDSKSSLFR